MAIDIKPAFVLEGATIDLKDLRAAIKGRRDDDWLIVGEPDRYRAVLIKEIKPVLKSYKDVVTLKLSEEAGFDPWIERDTTGIDLEKAFREAGIVNGRLIVGTNLDLSVASAGAATALSADSIFDVPDKAPPGEIDPRTCPLYPNHNYRDDGDGGKVCDECGYRPRV